MFLLVEVLVVLEVSRSGEVMSNLETRSQGKRTLVRANFFIFAICSSVELYMFFEGSAHFTVSLVTFAFGVAGLSALYWSFLKERQFIVSKLVTSLNEQKNKSIDVKILKNVVEKDVRLYLKKTHLFTPKFTLGQDEFSRVGGLSKYLEDYRAHSDLNLLEGSSKKVLEQNDKLSFSLKEIVIDLSLIILPFLMVSMSASIDKMQVFTGLVILRGLSFILYGASAYKAHNLSPSLDRLEHFLFGNLNDSEAASTRLELTKLKDTNDSSVFFLIDNHRKHEVEKILEFQTSGLGAFKDWSVISVGNSSVKGQANSKNAFVVFPSEMGFPYEEMKEFFGAFEKVIIIDSSPSYALDQSAVFYLDHNQDIKRVHIDKNLERMSGDKGLILRNFKKYDVTDFFKLVEEKTVQNKPCYLVYQSKDKHADFNLNVPHFVYPSGCKVMIVTDSVDHIEEGFYCDLSEGAPSKKLERAKNFVANCSYHQIYSSIAVQNKMKHSYRVS